MERPPEKSAEIVIAEPSTGEVAHTETPMRDQLAAAWLIAQRSPNTRAAYHRDVVHYFAWCDRNGVDVLGARRVHVDAYARWLEHGEHETRYKSKKSFAPTTIARKLTAVSSYYAYAASEAPQWVPTNPAANVKRPEVSPDSTTIGLDRDEAVGLLLAAEEMGKFELALAHVFLTTGVRVSELAKLDTSHLAYERGHRVITVTRKRGAKQKLPLAPDGAAAVDDYLGGRVGPVFLWNGVRATREQIAATVRKIARRAQIDKKVGPHVLRHVAATLALDGDPENGVEPATIRDVQGMLGHRDPRTTTRYDRARGNLDRSPVHSLARTLAARAAAARETAAE